MTVETFVNDFALNFNLLSLTGVTDPFIVSPVVFNVNVTVSDPPINQRNSLALLSYNILAL